MIDDTVTRMLQSCNNAVMQSTETGLRERKRVETRHRIADAALDLTLEHGLEGATVEAISAAAGVSPRTFFNYFDSKDDALLNAPDAREIDADGRRRRGGEREPEPARGRRALLRRADPHEPAGGSTSRRSAVSCSVRHPHLLAAAFRQLGDTQEAFSGALVQIAAARAVGTDQDTAWADVAITAAAIAVRGAMKEAAAAPEPATADQIEERANALLTTTWENLT